MSPKIVIVGSTNYDLTTFVDRLPASGETLRTHGLHTCFGGKGANQAITAARLGADVHFVGMIGDDVFGQGMQENFRQNKVSIEHLGTASNTSSGVATIAVEPEGQNTILVTAGANAELTTDRVDAAAEIIAKADVLICQLEIPIATTVRALEIARQHGTRTILNPAPSVSDLPTEAYQLVDCLCPNETEAASLTGQPVEDLADAHRAAAELRKRGARSVIITLGDRGCVVDGTLCEGDSKDKHEHNCHVPSPKVKAVDTTGAGDCFLGSLATLLARGETLQSAAKGAVGVAAISVQFVGTQTSLPTQSDLPDALRRRFLDAD